MNDYCCPRTQTNDSGLGSSLTLAITDVEQINYRLNYDLSTVYEWLSANKLTLAKTEFILSASRQKLSQFMESLSRTLNEDAVKQVTPAKSLGVYVDQNIKKV